MTDIIYARSGGLVLVAYASLQLNGDRYNDSTRGAMQDFPLNAFGQPVTVAHDVALPTDFVAGYTHTSDGTAFHATGSAAPVVPTSLWTASLAKFKPPISRPMFDAVFAGAAGEVYYQNVLTALRTIASTTPMTDNTAKVKRAMDALESPPAGGIAYPSSDWTVAPGVQRSDWNLLRAFVCRVRAPIL